MENIKMILPIANLLVSKDNIINTIFKWYEYNGVRTVEEKTEENGGLEKCIDEIAEFWSVYGRGYDNLAVCLADCETKEQAIKFCEFCNDELAKLKLQEVTPQPKDDQLSTHEERPTPEEFNSDEAVIEIERAQLASFSDDELIEEINRRGIIANLI